MKKLIYLVIILAVLGLGFYYGYFQKEKEVESLKMVIIPGAEISEEFGRYQPITEFVGAELGIPVELVVATDYSAVITSLKIGDADIARLGSFSYVLAAKEAGAEAVARGVKKKTGQAAYHSYVITRADSGIKNLEDLRGKTFAFADPLSTSGNLVPRAMFLDAGIDPDKDFERSYFAGTHSAVIEAVRQGNVDGGAVADNRYEDALAAGVIEEDELFIVKKSAAIPASPIAVRGDLPEELKKKIQDAFLTIPSDLAIQAVGKLTHYVKAQDSDYDVIREVARVLDLDLTKME